MHVVVAVPLLLIRVESTSRVHSFRMRRKGRPPPPHAQVMAQPSPFPSPLARPSSFYSRHAFLPSFLPSSVLPLCNIIRNGRGGGGGHATSIGLNGGGGGAGDDNNDTKGAPCSLARSLASLMRPPCPRVSRLANELQERKTILESSRRLLTVTCQCVTYCPLKMLLHIPPTLTHSLALSLSDT